jgi:hypothetical protein
MCSISIKTKESHLKVVKRILKYVCYILEYEIYVNKNYNTYLIEFSNADWVRNCDDRKSTSRAYFCLGNNLVPNIEKSRIAFHYQRWKLSILLLENAPLSCYG